MNTTLNDEQLNMVRHWAGQGTDLNGIQKKLQSECGIHLTYMEVRLLLLDHNIEIAREPEPTHQQPKPEAPATDQEQQAARGVEVTLDDIQHPGTLLSGKACFPGGAEGAWQIDQFGRLGWSSLNGQPTPDEMRDFQQELSAMLGRI